MTGTVLSAGQAALVLFGTFAALLIARVPVAFALGLACLPILLIEPRLSMMMLAQETFNAYNSFILLAVPFFLLTANLMSIGGITDRLVALSRSMVGHWPGSLAQINVVLSVFFAGISGSSTADAASQSKIFIDAQTREGYDLSFSIAITAVSAVLAVIIPPSILMIVWGGLEFTRFAWNRTSELADLPLWMIHVAWPVAGVTWIVFAGEQILDETRILLGAKQ